MRNRMHATHTLVLLLATSSNNNNVVYEVEYSCTPRT